MPNAFWSGATSADPLRGEPAAAILDECPHDEEQERQQPRGPLRPEREAGGAVEAEPRARPAAREPPALPQGERDEQRQQHVRHRLARVDHEALRGRDHEAGVAPGVGPEHVARRRVGHEGERDRRQDRGHQGRERGHLPDRPRDQRDQPGQQQRLVLIDDAVEVGKPHVAAREDVAREQRETRLVVGGEDDGAEVEDGHQRGHGADDDRRRQQPTRHGVIAAVSARVRRRGRRDGRRPPRHARSRSRTGCRSDSGADRDRSTRPSRWPRRRPRGRPRRPCSRRHGHAGPAAPPATRSSCAPPSPGRTACARARTR